MVHPPVDGRPAVFLDRDGVLNVDHGYVYKVSELQLLPGVVTALTQLHALGYALIVASNQSGVARGLYGLAEVTAFNTALSAAITAAGGPVLEGFYICPHHPLGQVTAFAQVCDCRKPAPGLLLRAAAEHGIDLASSAFVGDKDDDMRCAQAAGVMGVQIVPDGQTPHEYAAASAPTLAEALPRLIHLLAELG